MKALVLGVLALTVVGCSSLPAFLGGTSNQIEAVLASSVAGTYVVTFTKDGQTVYSETWECTKDVETGKLTGCHKR